MNEWAGLNCSSARSWIPYVGCGGEGELTAVNLVNSVLIGFGQLMYIWICQFDCGKMYTLCEFVNWIYKLSIRLCNVAALVSVTSGLWFISGYSRFCEFDLVVSNLVCELWVSICLQAMNWSSWLGYYMCPIAYIGLYCWLEIDLINISLMSNWSSQGNHKWICILN